MQRRENGKHRSDQPRTTFQLLPDTLGLGPEVWRVLSKCHDVRNRTEYEAVLDVDERLVLDLGAEIMRPADFVRTEAGDGTN